MAKDFWKAINKLYQKKNLERAKLPSLREVQPPVQGLPTRPSDGPLSTEEIMDLIRRAGADRRVLELTYNGQTRLVEPYSMRNRTIAKHNPDTGLVDDIDNWQFYGFCSIHDKIHSFIPSKIQYVSITNRRFAPRWDIEF